MINYKDVFANTNGLVFPDTLSVNASGPSATDGTEFVKAMIDDIWGARQAVMDAAGLVPDGVTEGPGASQFLDALRLLGPGPSIPTEWHAASDPSVTGHRALLMNGQGILRASFPELDALVYVGDGNNAAVEAAGGAYYRADDAAGTIPNIAGVYLILPESRGLYPRGLDPSATYDPDGASRYLGDIQLDAFQGHWHAIFNSGTSGGVIRITGITDAITSDFTDALTGTKATTPEDDGVNGTPRIDSETRSVNRSTRFVVWY